MSIAEKLTTIVENEQKVYESGKQAAWSDFWDAIQNKGQRTDYNYAFQKTGFTTESFKPKYDLCPTKGYYMFFDCGITDDPIEEISEKALGVKFDTSQCVDIRALFYGVRAKKVGTISALSSTTSADFVLQHLFAYSTCIEEIEKIILKDDGSQGFNDSFIWCSRLREIRFDGVIGKNLSFQYSPLSKESIANEDNSGIFNCLSDTASGKTLTLKLSAVQKAFETSSGANDGNTSEEWLALVASKSNWTITLA